MANALAAGCLFHLTEQSHLCDRSGRDCREPMQPWKQKDQVCVTKGLN